MKPLRNGRGRLFLAAAFLLLTLGSWSAAFGQLTPSDDAYVNSAKPTTNLGTASTLNLQSAAETSFLRFDLSSVPAGYTGSSIAKATLKLYVASVGTAGSFNVDYVSGTWAEKTITYSLQPAIGTTIASSVPLTSASAGKYLEIDITSAMVEWLNGAQPNDGIALVANSPLVATFDSKENTGASHPAEIDIVYAGIAGVTTANGSGLTGGGSSGTLNLALTNSCSNKQVLQWNGSAWACATAGTGTVTSVGLSAPASDFTVGGSPITGAGTLNFAWNVAPNSANVANAIVKRDAGGNFAAQGIVASGLVNSSGLYSLATSPNTAVVFAQNSASTGASTYGVYGETDSQDPAAASVYGFVPFGGSQASGVSGITQTAYGVGVMGINSNISAGPYINGVAMEGVAAGSRSIGVWGIDVSQSGVTLQGNSGYIGAGVWGDTGNAGNIGTAGTAADGYAGFFENNSPSGYISLLALSDNAAAVPFFAENSATGGYCYVDSYGNLNCSGAKHAVVPIDGGQRKVALAAIESPKNWFEDFGSAHLSAGVATVALEAEFAQTVNTGLEYHVFLTPNGDCKGLYVSQKTATSFEVHEMGGGASSVSFDYRVVALRKNFENIRLQDHTKDFDAAKVLKTRGKEGTPVKVDMNHFMPHAKPVPNTHPIAQKTAR
jgi:hypothetical protein